MTVSHHRASLLDDLALLRQVLAADLRRVPVCAGTPGALVVLCGLPGTGKSHFARELNQRLPFLVLGSDHIRKSLVAAPRYTPGEHRRVFEAAYQLLAEFLTEGRRVIFDATNLNEKMREPLHHLARQAGARLLLVQFTASEELVRQRLRVRAVLGDAAGCSDADWRIHRRMAPYAEPVVGPHLLVDSSNDITPALTEVLRFAAP